MMPVEPEPGERELVCDVATLPADALGLDALARLALAARRRGRVLRLRHPTAELVELIAFAGLAAALGVEARGQAEEREERLGPEEERELDDPAVR
jgi:hypothetical protein